MCLGRTLRKSILPGVIRLLLIAMALGLIDTVFTSLPAIEFPGIAFVLNPLPLLALFVELLLILAASLLRQSLCVVLILPDLLLASFH